MNKRCSTCGISKSLSEYHRSSKAIDGHRSRCKECRKQETMRDRERHYESRIKPYQQQWAKDNAERLRMKQAEYYRNNLDKWHEARQRPDVKKAARRRARKWRRDNPDKVARQYRRYLNNEKYREYNQRRRTRLQFVATNDFSSEDWAETKEYFNGHCAYCGKKRKLTVDHIVPISAGGPHTRDNIVPACRSCNSRKKDNNLIDVATRLASFYVG